jgi:dihydropteroate synthase
MTLKSINVNGRLIDFSTPKVMAILNVTPDSFFEKSRYSSGRHTADNESILNKVGEIIEQGVTFIDIGGYSTRPKAIDISVAEELDRVLPVIEIINKNFPETTISIDTFRSEVARKSIEVGAGLINDISGGNLDENMFQTVADLNVPYILMHSRGNPETMNQLNDYNDLTLDVITELQQKVYQLRQLGVKDIIIDPGFGFAKNAKQGFEMMRNLTAFQIMELPLLVGISRKSMIWRTLNITANEALNGTTALNMFALMQGANVLRVHDVKEAMETVRLFEELGLRL